MISRIARENVLSLVATEGSSYVVKLPFKDEDGTAMAPVSLTWTLAAEDGEVINSRYRQNVTPLATTVYIVLSGNDLQLIDRRNTYENRILLLEGTYNSTYGTGLPFKKEILFRVRNLIMIAIDIRINAADQIFTNDYLENISCA